MNRFCIIDFETASKADLKKTGAWHYAEHPSTHILCLGYSINGGPVQILTSDDLLFPPQEFVQAVEDPDCYFVAHNVAFEKAIWRHQCKALGWPDIPDERYHDTMAVCGYKALPLKLEKAGAALNLPIQKDMAGHRIMMALAKPKKDGTFDTDPEKLAKLYAYNRDDVSAELALHRRVRSLSKREREVWLLDQTINERGIRLDMDLVAKCQKVVADAKGPALAEFQKLTGIEKPMSPKLLTWLQGQGLAVENLQKETVAALLGENEEELDPEIDVDIYTELAPNVERVLQLRKLLAGAAIKKLFAMQSCISTGGKAHGLIQYHGASTGRWAGRLFQPHNFPRPTLKEVVGFKDGEEVYGGHDPDMLVQALLTGDAEWVRCLFGEPLEAVANALRHILIASEGNLFQVGDFKSIEACIVLALAGQRDKCDLLEAGKNLYVPMAEAIYHRSINKVADLKEYTIGKNTILGCGFGMGGPTFQRKYAKKEPIEFCNEVVRVYRKEECPRVPYVWYGLEDAAAQTVWTGKPHSSYGVTYALEDAWLTARLPSDRKLYYYAPVKERNQAPWDPTDIKPGWSYMAWKAGRWKRVHAYGGLQTENVVSGLARDLLVDAMFKCEAENMPIVLTVHDEIVNDLTAGRADATVLRQIMRDRPAWAKGIGIPVDADCWVGERYRK